MPHLVMGHFIFMMEREHSIDRMGIYAPALLFVVALLLTWFVYTPGLSGGFVFDDWSNVVHNTRVHVHRWDRDELWQATRAGFSGAFGRPLSMLSFGLNHVLTGLDPYYLKLTNLVIHLVCGLGIFLLTRLLLLGLARTGTEVFSTRQAHWVALTTAAAWLLHPLNLTPVLYVVQRMTSLSALFVILGLLAYAWGRLRMLDGRSGLPYVIAGLVIGGPLAVLSKENGILLPLYMGLMELTVFRLQDRAASSRRAILIFFGLVLVLPLLWLGYRIAANPALITGGYGLREFTLSERLLTEGRALWFYIRLVLLPDPNRMGLFHDDFTVSTGWFEPPDTLSAIIALGLLLPLAWTVRQRAPLVAFGILFFLAGHSLESSVIALELVHEHRNYLPGYGLLLAVVTTLLRPDIFPRLLPIRAIAAGLFVALLAIGTMLRADTWSNPARLAVTWAERQPESARAQYEAGQAYARLYAQDPDRNPELYQRARQYMLRAVKLDPGGSEVLAGLMLLQRHAGQPLEAWWFEEIEQRLRSTPIRPSSAYVFEAIISCRRSPNCPLDHEQSIRLFDAAVGNPQAGNARRAHIYDLYGRYHAEVVGDAGRALALMRRAADLVPQELPPRLHLIELLIALGDGKTAAAELQIATQRDRWQAFKIKIAALEARLATLGALTP